MHTDTHPLAGLRAWRIRAGVSIQALAKAIGVSEASYYRFERGERRIYLDKAHVLAKMLGCRVDALADAPHPYEQKLVEQVEEMMSGCVVSTDASPTPITTYDVTEGDDQ